MIRDMQQQFEHMNVMVDLIYDRLERRDKLIEQLLDSYDKASDSSSCKLKWGSLTKKEEKIALKPIKEKLTTKFQPNGNEKGHIASQFLDSDGWNATLFPLPSNQMDEEQLQIKHSIGEKNEEFKNVFLEQMPSEQSPIKMVVIDSRTNPFEEKGNDIIQLEDPSHELEEKSQDDRVEHEGELWTKHVPARASTRARAKRIQQAMQRLLLHVHGGVVELLGGLHVEQEVTTVHILEIYLEDDLSSKSAGQYFLSLKPSLDDPEFNLILLLLGLAAGSSRFASGEHGQGGFCGCRARETGRGKQELRETS
ncbi:hypothetical protein CDL15_Pgr009251 [Punica granatum]|uniref:Uncharacterized protein n=1 Tax=Punica granatum TaxID=22663 RepID=A0A218WVQ3_PUNGR|nr:hypothetical protein CDL15_Pgr009251 [Punica granatum]